MRENAGIIEKGIGVLKSDGLSAFAGRALRYLVSPFLTFSTYNIYELYLNKSIPVVKPSTANYRLAVVSSLTEIDMLINDGMDFSTDPDFGIYAKGFDKGAILFLVFVGGKIAHTSWVSLGHQGAVYDALFSSLDFGNAGYIGPCNTFEQFRGTGLYPFVLTNIFQVIVEHKVNRAVISTRNNNSASIRGIVKAGFKPLCVVKRVKLFSSSFFIRGGAFE